MHAALQPSVLQVILAAITGSRVEASMIFPFTGFCALAIVPAVLISNISTALYKCDIRSLNFSCSYTRTIAGAMSQGIELVIRSEGSNIKQGGGRYQL